MKPKLMSLVVIAALLFSLVGMALLPTPASAIPVTLHVRDWVKNSTAVLPVGASGFDADGVGAPSIIKESSTSYKMWYTGRSGSVRLGILSIGYATSSDGVTSWSKNASAVLSGTAGAWDSSGVGFASVILDGTTYKMWYTGYSGAGGLGTVSKIGYATSPDGTTWTKYPSNASPTAVVSPVAGTWEAMGVGVPFVMKDGTTYKMWYTGMKNDLVPSIGYATSTDGITWAKHTYNPVLTGDVGGASVIKDSDVYRMWYTHRDALGVLQIGYASSNNGTSWTTNVSLADLVASLSWEGVGTGGVGSAFAMKDGTVYKLWYTGVSSSLVPTIGYAAPTAGGSNYATIQAAINAAATNDTIIVHAGTYAEQLTVPVGLSGLTIKSGQVGSVPVIDATGYNPAVTIAAPGVTFKGFIVKNSTDRGIRLTSTAIGSTISYNSITGTTASGVGVFNGLVDETTSGTTTATLNWWGHASGAAGIGGGSGSGLLSGNSNPTSPAPWLTQHPLTWLQDSLGYLGDYRVLSPGWNLVSTPYALDSTGDTLGEVVALGDGLNIHPTSPSYYYNAATQTWAQVTSSYVLSSVDAIYVNMAAQDKVLLLASTSVSAPAKSLSAGWNLISLSFNSDPYHMKADGVGGALNSLGSNYSYVISPSLGQTGWTFIRGETIASWDSTPGAANAGWLRSKEGYWVYMTAASNLGGLLTTPLGNAVPSSW